MRIIGKRIRTIEGKVVGINVDETFYVGLNNVDPFLPKLQLVGFSPDLNVGELVLPNIQGRISRLNAEGGFVALKHLPKEPATREITIKDWHGRYHTVDIEYQRYQRQIIPPPSIELLVVENASHNKVVRGPALFNSPDQAPLIKHVINLFLELFGECDILQENLLPAFNVPVTRLNWNIPPAGDYPWAVLQPAVANMLDNVTPTKRHLLQERIETISNHNPNFVAVGKAGFRGYMVFGFPNKNFYLLESMYSGNATYVFGQNWPTLSELSKGEILSGNLQANRFIHKNGWQNAINQLFI